jgi:hypothetical protein
MSNIIRDRRDDILRSFTHALDQCINGLDSRLNAGLPPDNEVPKVRINLLFTFPSGVQIGSAPAWDLQERVPDPTPAPKAYVVGETES